jgi:thiol-disulfide isomerase/thioredoxin
MFTKDNIPYIMLALIGLIILAFTVSCSCKSSSIKEKMTEESLIFFYADWCGYCKQFKPEVEKYKGVKVQYVDCSQPDESQKILMKEYDVTGFPAMFYKANNSKYTFNKARNLEGINDFVNECRAK